MVECLGIVGVVLLVVTKGEEVSVVDGPEWFIEVDDGGFACRSEERIIHMIHLSA